MFALQVELNRHGEVLESDMQDVLSGEYARAHAVISALPAGQRDEARTFMKQVSLITKGAPFAARCWV